MKIEMDDKVFERALSLAAFAGEHLGTWGWASWSISDEGIKFFNVPRWGEDLTLRWDGTEIVERVAGSPKGVK